MDSAVFIHRESRHEALADGIVVVEHHGRCEGGTMIE